LGGREIAYIRVRTGETVFGIAQQHGLTVEELTEQNPQVKSGLKVGMVLNIQPKITAETNEEVILPALPENFVIHEVQQKESLYGLSKQYNILSIVLSN
jgi:LysM repeat protein